MDTKLVVIGNGPSLRGFDLRRLRGVDTLGMNAAYRHWDRIGWYPDIYCCLDDELINTHWKEIKRLIDDGHVHQAFLSGHFLQYVPEAAHDTRYRFLDSFVEHWHHARGKLFGLDLIEHPAFRSSDPTMLTTGAYAVRFGIMRGYKRIALMGIDLKFVELIPEARLVEGIKLRITETPEHNPNYFFDDYQRAGDTFQVPNPESHNRNLHLGAFETLRNDAIAFGYDVEIVNTNLASALHEQGVLPYESIDDFLGRSALGAVVVPTNARERNAILDNLWLWDQPAFSPYLHMRDREPPRLVFYFNNDTGKEIQAAVVEAYEQTRTVKKCFSGLEFRYLSLYGEDDHYGRDCAGPVGQKGFKAGPNNQFFETIKSTADLGRYIFFMETDCVPIRVDWLGQLQDTVCEAEPFWILGSIYRGKSALERAYSRHINGNAIYAVGDSGFQHFVSSVWRPALDYLVALDRRYAYDMVLETIFGEAKPEVFNDGKWQLLQSVAHKFRYTDFIRNYAGQHDIDNSDPDLVRKVLEESPITHLVHGHPFSRAVHRLRETKGSAVVPTALKLEMPEHKRRYLDTVTQIREAATTTLPTDATVIVISKGDDQLLNLNGRRAWHFPRANNGLYAGHYPLDSAAAIEHLETLRANGANYLLMPNTAFWWFDHYPELKEHLDKTYKCISTHDCCVIYQLSEAQTEEGTMAKRRRRGGPVHAKAAKHAPAG